MSAWPRYLVCRVRGSWRTWSELRRFSLSETFWRASALRTCCGNELSKGRTQKASHWSLCDKSDVWSTLVLFCIWSCKLYTRSACSRSELSDGGGVSCSSEWRAWHTDHTRRGRFPCVCSHGWWRLPWGWKIWDSTRTCTFSHRHDSACAAQGSSQSWWRIHNSHKCNSCRFYSQPLPRSEFDRVGMVTNTILLRLPFY